ncbi:MAG: ArsR/SmtB family transcription factor [Candidatus Dormibacteria bacterium]
MAADAVSLRFAALADPLRRDLVARLARGQANVQELARPYPVSLQAVSKHLKVLERAGLVTRSRRGRERPVRLQPLAMTPLQEWLERYRQDAEESYRRLDLLLRAIPDPPGPARRIAQRPEGGPE